MRIRTRIPRWPLALTLVLAGAAAVGAAAAEVRYVGAITEGPTSPTSLVVGGFGLAALEPFERQIEVFTADGVLASEIDIAGDARGLARLHGGQFLFCDREGGTVQAVDPARQVQTPFATGLGEPVDVVFDGERVLVLDAASRSVIGFREDGGPLGAVKLQEPTGLEVGWLSDLAWDPVRRVVYVLDQTHSRVLAFEDNGAFAGTFCSFGGDEGQISRGGQIVCDAEGWIYVTDRYQGRVVIFDENWRFVLHVDPLEMGGDRLMTPTGFAVDDQGFLYVAETEGAAIHLFHLDRSAAAPTELVATAASPGPGAEMAANRVQVEAGIRGPAALADRILVDFRLFAVTDTATVLDAAEGLPLTGGTVLGDIVLGSVTWRSSVDLEAGVEYGWQARARAEGITGAWMATRTFRATAAVLPFELEQNSPNPFNPRTVIFFTLATGNEAEISVYDIRGRLLWRKDLTGYGPGRHQVVWEGKDNSGVGLPSGVYFYKLTSGQSVATRKMVLTR